MQARNAPFYWRGGSAPPRLGDGALEKCVQLRGWDSAIARFIGAQCQWQDSFDALPRQRRDSHDGRPVQKLHLIAQASLECGSRARLLILESVPLVDGDDD